MTKTVNQIIFFFLHQNQNIFFSNIGNQNIFLEKNHNPPPFQVKWSFPNNKIIKWFLNKKSNKIIDLRKRHDLTITNLYSKNEFRVRSPTSTNQSTLEKFVLPEMPDVVNIIK